MGSRKSAPAPIVRKVNGEMVVLFGWGRAILLQLAHPLVAQGVCDHSLFGSDPGQYFARARRTVGAMLALTFGTDDEAGAIAAHINAIHDRVHGTLPAAAGIHPAGTPYSAGNPELLRWVHATLIDSLPLAYTQFVGPLSRAEEDAYCAEAAAAAPLLRLPQELAPANTAERTAYMREMYERGSIHVTPAARQIAQALLRPSLGPASPLFGIARLATVGLLPPVLREAYGFEWNARRQRRFARMASVIRRARSLVPPLAREWPAARRAARRPAG